MSFWYVQMIHNTVLWYVCSILHCQFCTFCIFMTYTTSCCLCDTCLDLWNVCICIYVNVSFLWLMSVGVRHSISRELKKSFSILPAGKFHMYLTWTAGLLSSINHLSLVVFEVCVMLVATNYNACLILKINLILCDPCNIIWHVSVSEDLNFAICLDEIHVSR